MKTLLLLLGVLLCNFNLRAERVYALTTNSVLFTFDSATPGFQDTIGPLTGLVAGHTPVGMDFRPATGELFLLSQHNSTFAAQLYTVNLGTAALTAVGAGFSFTNAAGTDSFGFDFNPLVDRIRVIRGTGENYRLHPVTGGIAAVDATLVWDVSAGFSSPPIIGGAAYGPNFAGTATTTLYGYDYDQDILVRIGGINGTPSPNNGAVFSVGPSGIVALRQNFGMDISGATSTAYAAINDRFYTVNLATGQLALIGPVTGRSVMDIAIQPPRGELIYALSTNGTLFTFDSQTPSIQSVIGPVTGLVAGQKPVALDFRPATGELFLMGYQAANFSGQLYTADLATASLTAVGAGFTLTNSSPAGSFGFDFNPAVDRIRVIRADGANYRLNPITGAIVLQDTTVTWNGAFPGVPQLSGLAYANNFAGATLTTLYGYESSQNRLVTVGSVNGTPNSPNGGLTFDLAPSGLVATNPAVAMDISGASGLAYAVVNNQLYRVDTNSAAFTFVGNIPGPTVEDISVFPLWITRITPVTGAAPNSDVALTFASSPGLLYKLQSASNAPGPVWTDVNSNISGLAGTTSVTNANAAAAGRRFYRVTLQP